LSLLDLGLDGGAELVVLDRCVNEFALWLFDADLGPLQLLRDLRRCALAIPATRRDLAHRVLTAQP
jgi:hypothetical protein